MYQLVTVVIAIALFSIVVAAGTGGLRPGRADQTDTQVRVMSTYRAIEMGVGAYRVANGGAVPDPVNWRDQIAPYSPYAIQAPRGLSWSMGATGTVPYVCVSGTGLSADQHRGLQAASDEVRGVSDADHAGSYGAASTAVLAKSCGATTAAADFDGTAALTFPLQAGG